MHPEFWMYAEWLRGLCSGFNSAILPPAERHDLGYGVWVALRRRNFLSPLAGVDACRFSRVMPLVECVVSVLTVMPELVQLLELARSVETMGTRLTLEFVRE